ncbi:MAG: GNAT family N-acetyltransferase [Deltaproteobacteria bacterium]|nr:MAG: GNAT family N-acetyltransferase [Deltaproteobacteria bacterium]
MYVRPVTADDAPGINALMNPIHALGLHADRGPWTVDDQQAFIQSIPRGGVLLAAVDGEEIVGLQDVRPAGDKQAEIHTFVKLGRHGEGIGTALFDAMQLRVEALGTQVLWATMRAHDAGAVEFYKRLGFEVVGIEASRVRARWRVIPRADPLDEPTLA